MKMVEGVNMTLGVHGSFDCLDKDGNLLKRIYIAGNIPLDNLEQDTQHGIDNSKRMQEGRFRRYYRAIKWW